MTDLVEFRTEPSAYRHWRLDVDGAVATLTMDVAEDGGLREGYELKLNSYDLGVDIELYDAVQRLRFEHPTVRTVVVTSGKDKIFCAGANIRMLAASSHPWKVNFCKFTNETRNGIEDATANSGQTYVAALNGTASGGGYELALACDHIMLVDDRSSTVSLPELPLLGVLPGTGGLTRVVDKRHVRRDRADYFATKSEGLGGKKAVQWRLVDEVVPRPEAGTRRCPPAPSRSQDAPRAPARESPCRRWRRPAATTAIEYRWVAAHARPRHPHGVDRGARSRGRRTGRDRRRRLLDPRDDPRARRPDPRPAHQRTRTRHVGVPHPGRRRRRCSRTTPSCSRTATSGSPTRCCTTSSAP